MRNRIIVATLGIISLAVALVCTRRDQPTEPTAPAHLASAEQSPTLGAALRDAPTDVAQKPRRPTSIRDSRALLLRNAALAALQSAPNPAEDVARRELAVLEVQRVENASAILRAPPMLGKERDPVSVARADELVTSYAQNRKQLLAEMYEEYLKLGPLYDPSRHLRAIDDAAADFAAEAEQLESEVPGVAMLGQMLEATSLKRPSFLDGLHARKDEGV